MDLSGYTNFTKFGENLKWEYHYDPMVQALRFAMELRMQNRFMVSKEALSDEVDVLGSAIHNCEKTFYNSVINMVLDEIFSHEDITTMRCPFKLYCERNIPENVVLAHPRTAHELGLIFDDV